MGRWSQLKIEPGRHSPGHSEAARSQPGVTSWRPKWMAAGSRTLLSYFRARSSTFRSSMTTPLLYGRGSACSLVQSREHQGAVAAEYAGELMKWSTKLDGRRLHFGVLHFGCDQRFVGLGASLPFAPGDFDANDQAAPGGISASARRRSRTSSATQGRLSRPGAKARSALKASR